MGSAEFQHFYPANTRKVYNFSKIIIKKIVTPEEWGISTMREREYTHPEQKTAVRFNYWDYVESFNKALLYENANKKHSWFIKICPNNFKQNIPNWFCKWWTLYGPTINILPENYKLLYAEWVDISPKILQLQKDDIYFNGISIMYFFIEFSIPWIMKWTVEVQTDDQEFPCLKRKFYTKFWNKLLHKNPEGQLYGQEIIDSITVSIEKSKILISSSTDKEDNSPFKQICRKIQMKGGIMSKSEILASYMEEVKRDLIMHLGKNISKNTDNMSVSTLNEDEGLAGESQNEDEMDVEEFLQQFSNQMEESFNSKNDKGKGIAKE